MSLFILSFSFPSLDILFIDLAQETGNVILERPGRIMTHEFSVIAYPPYMVAFAVHIRIGPRKLLGRDLLAYLNGFQHRTIAGAAAADIINLSLPGRLEKFIKGSDQILTVNIVSDLFSFVAKNNIRSF